MAASFISNQFKNMMLNGFDWTAATVQAALFRANAWAADPDIDVVASAALAGALELTASGYARQTLTAPAVAIDDPGARVLASCATIAFPAIAGGQFYDTLVVFQQIGGDGTSPVIAVFALGITATDGSDVQCVPDVSGLFEVT